MNCALTNDELYFSCSYCSKQEHVKAFEARCGCSRGSLTQLWLHLGWEKHWILSCFCLHMTNPHSWEILQLFYVSSLIYTDDKPEKCLKSAKKLLIIKRMA